MSGKSEAGLRLEGSGGAQKREGEESIAEARFCGGADRVCGRGGARHVGAAARGGGGAARLGRGLWDQRGVGFGGPPERVCGACPPLEGREGSESLMSFLPRGRSQRGQCLSGQGHRE